TQKKDAKSARNGMDDDGRVDAMLAHEQGLVHYREWLLRTRSRYLRGEIGYVDGDEEEKLLRKGLALFEEAGGTGRPLYWLEMDFGNALRASRMFQDAVKKYRRANDIDPAQYAPLLNIAVALLDKIKEDTLANTMKDRYVALRHVSSYLGWISDGGPFD